MAEGEHRQKFWQDWSRWDKIVALGLSMVLTAVTAEIAVEYFEERAEQRAEAAQERRDEKRDIRTRECIVNVIEGIRTYLNERGEISTKDRDSVNRVIRTVAEQRRAGSTDPAALDAALRNFERVQRQVEKERNDSELSDFPTGQCVGDIKPLEEPKAVEPTDDATEPEPTREDEGTSADEPANAPREQKAAKKSGRKSPKPRDPATPPRPRPTRPPSPPAPTNPPVVDIDPPDIDIDIGGILSVQVEPGEGIEVDLLPEKEPLCGQ